MNISTEQWLELDAVADSIKQSMTDQLDPRQLDVESPLDDRAFYVLATSFMFLYNKLRAQEKLNA